MNKVKCLKPRNSPVSLDEEEKLSEAVRLFPCLYSKANRGYMEKDMVENAWAEAARKQPFIAENGKDMINF